MEMITLYYLDGDELKSDALLYGGQPADHGGTYDARTKTVELTFVSASNLKSPTTGGGMHNAVYTFLTTMISRPAGPSRRIRRMPSRKMSHTSA